MPRVNYYDKRVGVTYVYDAVNYYDPEKKQSRSKRTLIGKLDPETGELVPCGKRGRHSTKTVEAPDETDYKVLYEGANRKITALGRQVEHLEEKNAVLEQKCSDCIKKLEADKKKFAAIANMLKTEFE